MRNLTAIKPGSFSAVNLFRCYRIFWNFAWTIADNVRFKELREIPDWTFIGLENFQRMERGGGAVLLTAHMGSYDLGAHIFSETSERRIVMVRAPETDPQTRAFEETHGVQTLRVEFNTQAADLAFDLLARVRSGEIVAIQGDRVTPGIAAIPAELFGKRTSVPAGPFALAMAARVPIYPTFIVRQGYRSYVLISGEPIEVTRTRDREEAFAKATAAWTQELERVIRAFWFQWFAFEAFSREGVG
jgi:KDO2-lipid IV(A) lauroyltransferase